MHLAEIWIYPVKSFAGIRVTEAVVEEGGLRYDRRWMVIDESGRFLTQREHPEMTLIDVNITTSRMSLWNRQDPSNQLIVPMQEGPSQEPVQVQIWNDLVTAYAVGAEADKWLSGLLGKPVRLVKMQDARSRLLHMPHAEKGGGLSFADEFPYLLTCISSLENLNGKLETPVDMRRFRPNLVIAGSHSYEEDHWSAIQIGSLKFEVCQPCERCMVINVDPDQGVRSREPLKTLASYRKQDRKILFGQDLVNLDSGVLREGAEVVVL